ncbi:MAG TPA: polyphenol oxidase family protein [Actinomycetota bacterium]|jgi:YfiH family protein|nr:polyphenol oxidase family protein [Actinomycetota bacterium]
MTSISRLAAADHGGVLLFGDPEALASGVVVAFSGRVGGVSEPPYDSLNVGRLVGDADENVTANRKRLAEAAGLDPGSFVLARQVHGAEVIEARAGELGALGRADALVCRDRGLSLMVLTADCVPVLLQGNGGVAAVHAGWRGLAAGVIEAAAGRLGPVRSAWVGPSIRSCCYEVGDDVVTAFARRELPLAGRRRVDPHKAAVEICRRLGAARIAVVEECTACDSRFYSHRRDGVTGRQAGLISLSGGSHGPEEPGRE